MSQTCNSLEDQIGAALKGNPYLFGRTLRAETHEGTIILRGFVHTYYQKQMAQEAVRHIDGVAEILNELEVAHTG